MTSQPVPIREVSAAEALELAAAGYRIIDVREPVEWKEGHIPAATLVPLADVPDRIAVVAPDRTAPLLVHCAVGARSLRAAAYLNRVGYTNVASLRAPIAEWRRLGGAWEAPEQLLTTTQQKRYARQLLIPEIGQAGQRRLLEAAVLVVGAGGLGSPASLYLAGAGVGTIGLVDDDLVEESNLQRQVLHTSDRIGMSKTESARLTLASLNPETRIVEHRERLDVTNVASLIAEYGVVVDGTDNFEARYAVNDAAVALRKPVVHGSVYRWDGQVTTFIPFEGPCYRCLHPVPPPAELVAACDVAGVLGVLPGIIGLLQANEVFKLLLGTGETLAGRLLMFDGLTTTFSEMTVHRDPTCPACGEGTIQ
jgi:sulfur-carrier protein adenylyltransferase/sulfurtransferase